MDAKLLAALAAILALAPLAPATPLVCGGDCTVQSQSILGFVPPAQPVPSGGRVTWTSLDTSHTILDNVPLGSDGPCFVVTTSPDPEPEDTVTVQFDIVGGAVTATSDPGSAGASARACPSAEALPGGDFLLAYFCQIHPWMRGALLVSA